jgi:UPF0755 protein
MAEIRRTGGKEKIILLLFLLLLTGIILLVAIGLNVLHEETVVLVGQPDPEISEFQRVSSDLMFFLNREKLLQGNNTLAETMISIKPNEPLIDILDSFQDQGVVEDAKLLRRVLIYTGADRRILPGDYPVSSGSSILDIASMLQNPDASLIKFTVLPGWRMEEIAAVLPESGLSIQPDEFLAAAKLPMIEPTLVNLGIVRNEGYFSPGQYNLKRGTTSEELISLLTGKFASELTDELVDRFDANGLTVDQAVILASIIEREAIIDLEKPIIASVFLNRLKIGMPLQSDPTVQYALGFNSNWGWWKSPLYLDDLKMDSPYNTYIHTGLPPLPISNPDVESINAVAFPADTPYFYFRALCDGSKMHVFSETLEEHINNGCSETE